MKAHVFTLAVAVVSISPAGAQTVTQSSSAQQIATAVTPLPDNLQSGARVLGYEKP